ncbi:hypothetical protein KR074_009798 [Drosophila pseudoananassae]|nr:hypothetical protein KR074_009798 [Drosophila pseudoananassae]
MSEEKSEMENPALVEMAGPSTSGEQQQEQQQVPPQQQGAATGEAKGPDSAPKKQRQRFLPMNRSLELPPLILEHTTLESVPQHLEKLMDQYKDGKYPPAPVLLLLLIYLLALESGFAEEETYMQKRHRLEPVATFSSFHARNVRLLSEQPANYTVSFSDTMFSMRLRTLLDKHAPEGAALVAALQSRLTAITVGDLLMVTLSPAPSSNLPGYSISLSIGRYVLNVQSKTKPIHHRFRKLDELSFQLKNNVFQPMRSQQLIQMAQKLQPSLLGLPEELYEEIFVYLNPQQMKVLSQVNRQLNYYSTQSKRLKGGRK